MYYVSSNVADRHTISVSGDRGNDSISVEALGGTVVQNVIDWHNGKVSALTFFNVWNVINQFVFYVSHSMKFVLWFFQNILTQLRD